MKIHPLAIGAVAAVGGAAIMLASGANAGTTSSSEQLIINQRISQAAVRRSNTALNYMGVIRTSTLDNTYGLNKSNPKGVTPLTQVTGAGLGWQTPQIRDGQVTSSKVADGAVTTSKIAANGVTQAKLSSKTYYAEWNSAGTAQRASAGVGTGSTSAGIYSVGPFPQDISACMYSATTLDNSGSSAAVIRTNSTTFLNVQTNRTADGSVANAPVSLMVYCLGS